MQEHHLKLRPLTAADLDAVLRLQAQVYSNPSQHWPKQTLERLLQQFGEGQLCIEDNGDILAVALTMRADYSRCSNPSSYAALLGDRLRISHDDNGDALFGLDLFVAEEFRDKRLGQRLYEARKELCRILNLKAILAVGRLDQYTEFAAEVSVANYVEKVEKREIYDPVLSFQLANDFDIKRLLREQDSHAKGGKTETAQPAASPICAVLMEWDNILFEPATSAFGRSSKSNVRVAAVQWQMRATNSLDDLLNQVEFFIKSMSAYRSDFALFPEFFNAPLMGQSADKNSLAAMQFLAELTPLMLERMSALAVSYNINIIAGSMPVLENGEIYNVAYLCRRDGTTDSQYKIHPTPSERYEWAMKGGDRLTVFDTDAGRIGILICYDVEFPELARILCLQGMQMLFVPFWTDTKNGFLRVQRCAQARAIENECYVIMAGSCGNLPAVDNLDIQYAQSAVYSPSDFAFPHDAIVSETTPNTEMELIVDLDLDKLKRLNREGAVTNIRDRRGDLYELKWIGRS